MSQTASTPENFEHVGVPKVFDHVVVNEDGKVIYGAGTKTRCTDYVKYDNSTPGLRVIPIIELYRSDEEFNEKNGLVS